MKAIALTEERATVNIVPAVHAALKLYTHKHGFRTMSDAVAGLIEQADPEVLEVSQKVRQILREQIPVGVRKIEPVLVKDQTYPDTGEDAGADDDDL